MKTEPSGSARSSNETDSHDMAFFSDGIKLPEGIVSNEPYIVAGNTLMVAYRYLFTQRRSASLYLSRVDPTKVEEIEAYIGIYRSLTQVLIQIQKAIPYAKAISSNNPNVSKPKIRKTTKDSSINIDDILRKNKITPPKPSNGSPESPDIEPK